MREPRMERELCMLTRIFSVAQGALQRLPAFFCQDCAATHPPLHDQEAPGTW